MATEAQHREMEHEEMEHEEMQFDQEISRRHVFASLAGILLVTVLAMVLMWPLSRYFVESSRARDLPLSEVQKMRRQQLEQENQMRARMEVRVFPQLEFPWDVQHPAPLIYDHRPFPPDPKVPPVPVVQVAPWRDMEAFLEEQRRIQGSVGWDDPEGRKAHIPIEQAKDKVLREGLPVQARPAEPEVIIREVPSAVELPQTRGAPAAREENPEGIQSREETSTGGTNPSNEESQ